MADLRVADRLELDRRVRLVSKPAPHTQHHIDAFLDAVLAAPVPGALVECGVYEGVSAAKWSHLADMLGRQLWLFDSFEGLPPNDEPHTRSRTGKDLQGIHAAGRWRASLSEAQETVQRYGVPDVVRWVPGWFDATLPAFAGLEPKVAAAYLDVDLVASTVTCLEHLWPLVTPGGVIVSQDGDFLLVIDAIARWAERADPNPEVTGLGTSKMVVLRKPGEQW
jgi:O-methyltransferase